MIGSIGLSAAGLVAALTGWIAYLATVPGGTVPRRPVVHLILEVGGAALGVAGIAVAARTGELRIAATVLGGFAALLGLGFVAILSQRKTPIGDIRVAIGDALPRFSAVDSDGRSFDSASLAGSRVLLKFFRGSW